MLKYLSWLRFVGYFILIQLAVYTIDEVTGLVTQVLMCGWVAQLARVFQEAVVNWDMVVGGSLALAGGVWGLHRAVCWGKESGLVAEQWRFGHTVAVTLLLGMLFGFSIAAVGIVEHVRWIIGGV